jgi:hypothetical protein
MAFSARTVKDRVAVGDDIFTLTDLGGGKVKLTPAPTSVDEQGTPINKAYLQPIENYLGNFTGTGAGKVPELDGNGHLPSSVFPPMALTDVFVVNSAEAMTALNAHAGDVAVRTDETKTYILRDAPASTLSNWQEVLTPPNLVISVNGKTGAVALGTGDITISTPNNFGNVTTLQGVLTYIGNVFGGTQKVAKLVADEFNNAV